MDKMKAIFLHGFASSGKGTKGRYLARRFGEVQGAVFKAFEFTPAPVDFEYTTITGMMGRLRQFVLDEGMEPFTLIGSSFGALVGMNYAQRFGGVDRSLLLAPALSYSSMASTDEEAERWREEGALEVFHYAFEKPLMLRYDLEIDGRMYAQAPPPSSPVTIIHGSTDDVVPVGLSRRYAADYPGLVELIEVDAGHDLNEHLDLIWEQVGAG